MNPEVTEECSSLTTQLNRTHHQHSRISLPFCFTRACSRKEPFAVILAAGAIIPLFLKHYQQINPVSLQGHRNSAGVKGSKFPLELCPHSEIPVLDTEFSPGSGWFLLDTGFSPEFGWFLLDMGFPPGSGWFLLDMGFSPGFGWFLLFVDHNSTPAAPRRFKSQQLLCCRQGEVMILLLTSLVRLFCFIFWASCPTKISASLLEFMISSEQHHDTPAHSLWDT